MSDPNLAGGDSPFGEPLEDRDDSDLQDVATSEKSTSDVDHSGLASSESDAVRQVEDRVLRAQAELENFRKRARRELEEERRYAYLPLFAEVLPAIDNLERAIAATEPNEQTSGLLDGVRMVADQLLGILAQNGCRRIEDIGATFDPNLHEAIGQESTDEFPAGTVSRVTRTGYQLHERIVRPPQVMISTGPAADSAETDD